MTEAPPPAAPQPSDPLAAPKISFLQFYIKDQHKEPFERFMERLIRDAREFPGCLWAYAFKAEDTSANYIVLSGWADAKTMVEFEEYPRHRRAALMGEEEFFQHPMVMKQYKRFAEPDPRF